MQWWVSCRPINDGILYNKAAFRAVLFIQAYFHTRHLKMSTEIMGIIDLNSKQIFSINALKK